MLSVKKNSLEFTNIFSKSKLLLFGLVLVIAIDQITKQWISNDPINSIFISWHENYGISFGIAAPNHLVLLAIILFIGLLLFLFFFQKNYSSIYYLGLIMSIAGGCSNLIDRINFGFVRDFITISILPIFNLADVCIVLGVALIIWGVLKYERKKTD